MFKEINGSNAAHTVKKTLNSSNIEKYQKNLAAMVLNCGC